MSFQNTTILGNLGQMARVSQYNGASVINFSVAVNKKWTTASGEKKESTTWFDCEYWPKSIGVADYLTGGKQVLVTGEVRAEAFTRKDNTTGVSLRLRVDSLTLADSNAGRPDASADAAPAAAGAAHPVQRAAAAATSGGPDDDLPF